MKKEIENKSITTLNPEICVKYTNTCMPKHIYIYTCIILQIHAHTNKPNKEINLKWKYSRVSCLYILSTINCTLSMIVVVGAVVVTVDDDSVERMYIQHAHVGTRNTKASSMSNGNNGSSIIFCIR